VKRLFAILSTVQGGVQGPALLLAIVAFANSFLGLFRDRLLATNFGASVDLDIYYAAFRIPDFLFALALLFVAGTAFIPIFIERKNKGHISASELLDGTFTIFTVSIVLLAVIIYIVAPYIVPYIVPGFEESARSTVIELTRILLLSPILLGISNLVSGVLQAEKRFVVYALSPVFYNLGIIIGILLFFPVLGIKGLAWGVVAGALMHLGIQLPALIHVKFVPHFTRNIDLDIFRIIRLSFPRTVALSFHQLTFVVVTAIASTVGVGSIAIFNLSYNLQSVPLIVIGLSYSVAAFPLLSELVVQGKMKRFYLEVSLAIRHIIFWTLPIMALFIALRAHFVRIVLGAGAFSWVDTRLTVASLLVFAFGMLGQSLILLFVRIYYALGRTREPVMYNLAGFVVVGAAAILFREALGEGTAMSAHVANLLRIGDIQNVQVLALPLAYVLGTMINALLLFIGIWRLEPTIFREQVFVSFRQVLTASILIGVVSIVVLRLTDSWFDLNTVIGLFVHGAIAGLLGITSGIGILHFLKNNELFEVVGAVRSRFWKDSPQAPEVEHL